MTITAIQAHTQIEQFATTKAKNDVRIINVKKDMPIGKCVRQGDIYVRRIEPLTDRSKYAEFKDNQLAPGNTQGSRHIVAGNVKLVKATDANMFTGPVIEATDEFIIQHPEHAHFKFENCDGACFAVSYQLDFQTRERVRD